MTEPNPTDSGVRSIRRLTIAVWVLGGLTILNIGVSLFAALCPLARFWFPLPNHMYTENMATTQDPYNEFSDWPLEKQIQKASVIAIARYQTENGKPKSVISEILKQSPDAKFYYKVGDEYRPASREGAKYGDGVIIFFTGSPASMRFSSTFEGDRIEAFGDIPIDTIREIVRKEKSTLNQSVEPTHAVVSP
jgi:hypothetical protein